jgi:arsenite methyltransferase
LFDEDTMKTTIEEDKVRQQVRERYGVIARLEQRGCGCGPSCGDSTEAKISSTDAEALGYSCSDVASVPEGSEMGLGCGNPTAIASIRPGETVLDLGSGGGFDCFLAAKQTGSTGKVIGVDMTPDMLSKARANAAKGAYDNVEFRLGEIENLPVADKTADLVISNCVINLSPNKGRVYTEIFRALKQGGRIAVSDIVALAPIPEDLKRDFMAYTGCVAGAASVFELESMLTSAGFTDIRLEIKQSSREFIDEWLPGKRAGDYVASANITATKPGAPCCGASCCE